VYQGSALPSHRRSSSEQQAMADQGKMVDLEVDDYQARDDDA
jgi:hypothetical protein